MSALPHSHMMAASLLLLLLSPIIFMVGGGGGSTTTTQYVYPYQDSTLPVETRVSDLLPRMTLSEKIGQMLQITRTSDASLITKYYIGSVLSGGNSPSPKPFASPSDWADMVDGFQLRALQTRLAIPLLYGVDAVHGHNSVYRATIFPHNIGLGCTRDLDLVRKIGDATALEVRATGIHFVFSPAVSVCRHPSWGRCYESFGEDPHLVKAMTEIIIGLQGHPSRPNHPSFISSGKVVATAKHFVGDGGTLGGIDKNNTMCSFKTLYEIHMEPFVEAIKKGVNTIMVSLSSWNGVKLHADHFLLSQVLKEQLGFKGFVISDFRGIDMLTDPADLNFNHSLMTGINAGIDMVMQPFSVEAFVSNLKELVHSGHVAMRTIDDAVRRILGVKFRSGVFEQPMANRTLFEMVGSKIHRDLAREAVRKSLVLLKNGESSQKPFLPLDKNARRILVAGSHADDIGNQCGGWTLTRLGASGNITAGTTVLSAIRKTVSRKTKVVYRRNVEDGSRLVEEGYSYAIVVVGERPYAESAGDDAELRLPEEGVQTMRAVCEWVGCVVVLMSGRPQVMQPSYLAVMQALVAAWLPGSEGGAGITDVIFGDYDFEGKLSRTWFKSVEQLGDAHYHPLFPFGFGLTMYGGS